MLNDDISIYNPRFFRGQEGGKEDRERDIGKREEKESLN
jgi:hypothetical protein